MKVLNIELENVKCYDKAYFEFEDGINFINGLNGAGKTTIIESIGFALFDYKAVKNFTSYFIRRGQKKACIKIVFENKDKNKFIVERKIGMQSAYNNWVIKDAKKEEEFVSGEENVRAWIRDNLGFFKEDNISDIYENIISVPQGMFVNVFLDTDKNRKNKFDPIFNLELYRKVYLNTASFGGELKEKIIEFEKDFAIKQERKDMVKDSKTQFELLQKEIQNLKRQMEKEEKKLIKMNNEFDKLNNIKKNIEKIQKEIEEYKYENEKCQNILNLKQEELKQSKIAKKILINNKEAKEKYIEAIQKQSSIQKRKLEYQEIESKIKQLEIKSENSRKIIQIREKSRDDFTKTIEKDKLKIDKISKEIEKEKEKINLKDIELAKKNILKNEYKEKVDLILKDIKNCLEMKSDIKELDLIIKSIKVIYEKNDEEKTELLKEQNLKEKNISNLKLQITEEKQKQEIFQKGLCPFLNEKCLNIKNISKEEYKKNINILSNSLLSLEDELKEIQDKIYQKEEVSKNLVENFRKEFEKFESEIIKKDKQYNIEKTILNSKIQDLEKKEEEINKVKREILNITEEIEKEKLNQKDILKEQENLQKNVKEYINLNVEERKNQEIIDKSKNLYEEYIKNENIALNFEKIEKEIEKINKRKEKIINYKLKKEQKLEEENRRYSENDHKNIKEDIQKTKEKLIQYDVHLKSKMESLVEVENKVKIYDGLIIEISKLTEKIDKYKHSYEVLNKIRQIIKNAPENISKVLIQNVNRKAKEIYTKISEDLSILEWKEGYEIVIRDTIDGKEVEKEFKQLSGGEQMTAALAIRIAMLEILTSVNIGVLDEPTVNMDVLRRNRLAEIMEKVGELFTQLFIVSHDDTFNGITDNIIEV